MTPKYTGKGDLTSDVERPVTGLGDVDVATTMEGLLDREVGVRSWLFETCLSWTWGQRQSMMGRERHLTPEDE